MLVIFSKLSILPRDRDWIESFRRSHDPQHAFVEPHFTFVFPFTGVPIEDVIVHAQEVANATRAIAFRLTSAAAVDDPFSSNSHVFLLPTEGAEELRGLHGRLYSGGLATKRHPTVSFVPHVTVGAFERRQAAERAAASLPSFDVQGRLDAIQVAEFDGNSLTELRRLALS